MKKLFLLLSLVFSCVSLYGQITIKEANDVNPYISLCNIKDAGVRTGEIRYFKSDGMYVLMMSSSNQFERKMHSIILGDSKQSAIQSIKDLRELRNSIKKEDELIVLGLNGKNTTIVKSGKGFYAATEGVAGYGYSFQGGRVINFNEIESSILNFEEN